MFTDAAIDKTANMERLGKKYDRFSNKTDWHNC